LIDTAIKNIFCVGRNYARHARELGNALPQAPLFFSKPTHAFIEAGGGPVTLPGGRGRLHYEAEWVVRIGRPPAPGMAAEALIDGMALGIDFTLRDIQSELKQKGYPWLEAKGFVHSAVVTPFITFPGTTACYRSDFTLTINGREVQRGNIAHMIFTPQALIDYCSVHFGLGPGDLIFTGTPEGVGQTADGDVFQLKWGNRPLGSFTAQLIAR
jgi:2-keto-4-pentenoate hydratase/2-oxohepta-3-ene-1,7-dioic acid hydratase in catechol pathway